MLPRRAFTVFHTAMLQSTHRFEQQGRNKSFCTLVKETMQVGTRLEKKEAVPPCLSGSQKLTGMRNVFCSDRDSFSQATLKHSAPSIQLRSPWDFSVPSTERSETSFKPLPGMAFSRGTQAALPIFLRFFS